MSRMTKALVAVMLCGALVTATSAAALRDDVQAAVDAIEKLRADDAKVQEYCAIQAEIDAAGDDEAKLDTAFDKLDAYFDGLGEEYDAMFAVEEELAPDSEDAQALDDAFAALDSECET
ncbi:MAG: hypothetical protein ACLFPA_06900 [Dichotomicrobium sp.]